MIKQYKDGMKNALNVTNIIIYTSKEKVRMLYISVNVLLKLMKKSPKRKLPAQNKLFWVKIQPNLIQINRI